MDKDQYLRQYNSVPLSESRHLLIRIPIDTTNKNQPSSLFHFSVFSCKLSKVVCAVIALAISLMTINVIWFGTYKNLIPNSSELVSGADDNIEANFTWRPPFPNLEDLIIVAGHGIFKGMNLIPDGYDFRNPDSNLLRKWLENEDNWYLMPYQRNQNIPTTFIQHIEKGIELAALNPESVLIFSGGQTRAEVAPRSEALSYHQVASALNWFGVPTVQQRSFTEEFARDSYENVLFSICRFKEITGHYPRNLTVISYPIKGPRFIKLHIPAIRFPLSRFQYVPYPLPSNSDAIKPNPSEIEINVKNFQKDPYGCWMPDLVKKKQERNSGNRVDGYMTSCQDIKDLLDWCSIGGKRMKWYEGEVPW